MANWISALVSLGAFVLAIIAYVFLIGRRFGSLEQEQRSLRKDLQTDLRNLRNDLQTWATMVSNQMKGILGLQGITIGMINSRQPLSAEELRKLHEEYSKLATAGIETFVDRWKETGSPLTNDEAERLKYYINKARQGSFFSPQEVEEYRNIVNKVEREHPTDPGVWPLIALGAFLFGLFVASQAKK